MTTSSLRLFFWDDHVYETVLLIFAPDREAAYQMLTERVKQEYPDAEVPHINSMGELTIPDEPTTILIRIGE